MKRLSQAAAKSAAFNHARTRHVHALGTSCRVTTRLHSSPAYTLTAVLTLLYQQ